MGDISIKSVPVTLTPVPGVKITPPGISGSWTEATDGKVFIHSSLEDSKSEPAMKVSEAVTSLADSRAEQFARLRVQLQSTRQDE